MITPTLSTALRSAQEQSNQRTTRPRCQYCGASGPATHVVVWHHLNESAELRTPTCAAHRGWIEHCAVVVRVEDIER